MSYTTKQFGHYAKRRDYTKVSGNLDLPDLISIQRDTYKWFIDTGIQEVFNEIFPVTDNDNRIILSLIDWEFRKPRRTLKEAKDESKTYEAPIYTKLSLSIHENNRHLTIAAKDNILDYLMRWIKDQFGIKNINEPKVSDNIYYFEEKNVHANSEFSTIEVTIKSREEDVLIVDYTLTREGDVFLGDFPLMTQKGTFIINGSEKVVVSQLVRSPGAYFKIEIDPKTGLYKFLGDLIPSRGTWLEFETDSKRNKLVRNKNAIKDIIQVKIEKSRKIAVTTLLTALGLTKDDVINIIGKDDVLLNTYEYDEHQNWPAAVQEIYKKIKAGETASVDGAAKFLTGLLFDSKKYDLTKAGRYKLIQKLATTDRVLNYTLAEDIKDIRGKVVLSKKTVIGKSQLEILKTVLEEGACLVPLKTSISDSEPKHYVQLIKVYNDKERLNEVINVVGINPKCKEVIITIADILATLSYILNFVHGIGNADDIDHLANRRIRTIGELLQNQFRIGMGRIEKNVKEKMSTTDSDKMKPANITNNKPLTAVIGEFFNLSQLSQFMDQTNPLAELANKRRLTALGPGGLSRDRASLEVRDVHYSHYGRICPIETPEGPNIGLINNLATYARINEYGFIETPYRQVIAGKITNEIKYLTAGEEKNYIIAQANIELDTNNVIKNNNVIARSNGQNIIVGPNEVEYIDVSPKQIVSIATSCIPFLENDDANRALMGANMQRQAIPLLKPQTPIVGTGVEYAVARDSGLAIVANLPGVVQYVDSHEIIIKSEDEITTYELSRFERSNQGTAVTHVPLVKVGDKVEVNQILADGPSMKDGELALGQNVIIAFMTWHGYNYEDAIIISERLVKDDVYTSMHIEEYNLECRKTKQGKEEITPEIPNTSEQSRRYLDDEGIVLIGTEVKEGDILVGKVTPKGQTQSTAEEKLLAAIFGEKSRNVKDNSLRVPNGGAGIVQGIKRYKREDGFDLPSEVEEVVKVFIVQKRKIREGDKMAGRHGNKGVISKVLPIEDMPFLEDGTPVDIMLNPLGVPSRMNIGQILELHLGMAAKTLGIKVATPVFDGAKNQDLLDIMKEAKYNDFDKLTLYDGLTGEKFAKKISVGVMYMLKLSHMVDDKLHARNVGPYSLITQQPLGGKAQNGGQRFGEMEVWALEAYGAAHTLQEILTIKSDDIKGRIKTYEAILRNKQIPTPGIPESFNVLTKELQGLGINIVLIDEKGQEQKVVTYDEEVESYLED
ncbi:MAG: DNA-directed RNA polymerase subunit beta [Spiroplasma ixodetis]|nr:DNA-directed RNA polymerase subunit beta [Spiroplasma ixodetis]MBP1526824.1 DNA-directed RNA polymerase subunit beta [Spiroplasma ixodetis]MBP1527855.1 DNA-directed RNA polymerase subunit beta [Spiroplasma ixodetis]